MIERALEHQVPTNIIEQPLWLRSEPVMPKEMVCQVVRRAGELRNELGIKALSSDLSPYRHPWVMPVRENFNRLLAEQLGTSVEVDWHMSATTASIEVCRQMVEIIGRRPSVYVDMLPDGWDFRQVRRYFQETADLVGDYREAEVVFLTHGTPEMGLSSFTRIRPADTNPGQYIIIDAAGQWTTFFSEPYRALFRELLSSRKAVVIGDLQKVMGYGLRYQDIDIGVNFALMMYSPNLFRQRLELAKAPVFGKTPSQLEHWRVIDSRRNLNSFPAANILYPYAFFDLYSQVLGEWTGIALDVAQQLRRGYQAEGELTIVARPVAEEVLQRNNSRNCFSAYLPNGCLEIEGVIPAFRMGEQNYGFFHVYPILASLGRENLYRLYSQIAERFFVLEKDDQIE